MNFDKRIYGHDSVRDALIEAQHKKCCYCEGKFLANAPGDVEHYRPKAAVRQRKDLPAMKPGYYWLAYTWENLYVCCPICNRSHKRDLFPLRDPDSRAVSHCDDLAKEEPLILDPGGGGDPRDHIYFRQDLAIGRTSEGTTTIKLLGLNRLDLCDKRREKVEVIRRLRQIVMISNDNKCPNLWELAEEATLELKKAAAPEAEFSAMAEDYLSTSPSTD